MWLLYDRDCVVIERQPEIDFLRFSKKRWQEISMIFFLILVSK